MLRLLAVVLACCLLLPYLSHPSPKLGTQFIPSETLFRLAQEHTDTEPEETAPAVILVAESDRFQLFYPEVFTEFLPLEQMLSRVSAGFERIERLFGKFEKRVRIYVVERIISADPDFPAQLTIQGLCFEENGEINVILSLSAADLGVISHELCHARLRDLKLSPPRWLEEGLAHFCEHEKGLHPSLFEILKTDGVMSTDEAKGVTSVTDAEMKLRATAWAIVYYLVYHDGKTPLEVASASTLPQTDVVMAFLEGKN